MREDCLDHLLDGLLGVKPKAVVGDVVFIDKPEKNPFITRCLLHQQLGEVL